MDQGKCSQLNAERSPKRRSNSGSAATLKDFWTARCADGGEGGLFVSREEAMKFARTARRRGQGVAKNAPAPIDLWK